MRAVLARLLELAYGCSLEVLEGLPYALEMALARGELDILVGVSSSSASLPLREALAAGELTPMSVLYQQQAGFFVSEAVLASLTEGQVNDLAQRLLLRAANAEITDATFGSTTASSGSAGSDSDVTAATVQDMVQDTVQDTEATTAPSLPTTFVNCPLSWQCHDINVSKLALYGLDVSVITPDNAVAVVASLQTAQAEGRPWLGFLWTPSWLVPTFALGQLAEPVYSDACWQADQACAYPADAVLALWRPEFAAQLPADMRLFFEQIQFAAVLSELLAFRQQALVAAAADVSAEDTLNETVDYFFRNYPEQWQGWLEPEVATRVRSLIQADTNSQNPTSQDPTPDGGNGENAENAVNDDANNPASNPIIDPASEDAGDDVNENTGAEGAAD
jgi:ABC-type proline/glycine betaine transport system substrate-binding protein